MVRSDFFSKGGHHCKKAKGFPKCELVESFGQALDSQILVLHPARCELLAPILNEKRVAVWEGALPLREIWREVFSP